VFAAQCGELSGALEARGVPRGPAHVANELLFGGWLARESGVPRACRKSLGEARGLLRGTALDPVAEELRDLLSNNYVEAQPCAMTSAAHAREEPKIRRALRL
jgi:hypothetical protein